jgi:nucleoid-associated protein EbfC
MRDIMGMMKDMAGLKAKMETMQAELDQTLVEGRSGGGMVVVSLSAKGDMKSLSIDPSLLRAEDKEIIEDLIVAAHADARAKSEAVMASKMQAMAGGWNY